MSLSVPVSWGELLDKISILEIKAERITQQEKLSNINHELTLLSAIRDEQLPAEPQAAELLLSLKEVNTMLWEIEDDIRICEKEGRFDESFINLARAVYKTNDKRAAIKFQLNKLLGSQVVEEKSYEDY